MDQVTPRINAALREKYVGRPVRIVGRVVDFQPPHATLEASGTLQVSVPAGTNIQQGHDFEVLGRVNPDLSLTTLSAIDFGTGFDYAGMDRLVAISQRYPEIFADKAES